MTPAALGMTPAALGMTPAALGMTPAALGMTPAALGMTPAALGMTPAAWSPGTAPQRYNDPMGRISRRVFLASLPAVQIGRAVGKGQQYPSEARKFADPLTEREVWRFTSPGSPHHLPHASLRFASQKNSFLLVAGNRGGESQVLRVDMPSGKMTQLTQGSGIAPFAVCLAPDERSFFFLQNGALKQTGLRTLREREIYRAEEGWSLSGDLGVSIDGRFAAVAEQRAPLWRLRVVETLKGKNWLVAEEKSPLSRPQIRPKRDQVLYTQDTTRLWLVNLLDGKQRQGVRPRQGDEELGPEYWSADGKLIGYAHYPDRSRRKATARAFNPDTREEQVLAPCTQFWNMRGNADHSALVGESRSKAGLNLYVLFPLTQREVTICEHASSSKSPESEPRPVFSPDSQWIYFTSDREGAPAVYRAGVADWVEKTG